MKYDDSKPMFDCIPPNAELEVAKQLTLGAKEYGRDNWYNVQPFHERYLDATLRHINAYRRGETFAKDHGTHHLAGAIASLLFILEYDLITPFIPDTTLEQ